MGNDKQQSKELGRDTGTNVTWHPVTVSTEDRERTTRQKGCVIWFTGLSGSGKSTLACALEKDLNSAGKITYLLDGDNIRCGLNTDLGFSEADRRESNRRVGHVAKLFLDANIITLVSLVSPFREERNQTRSLLGAHFLEIFVDTPLEICEQRDPKNLYKKARAGEIKYFTGISSPYEPPEHPDLVLHPAQETQESCVKRLHDLLHSRGYL